jgi:hypothetical protein
MVSMYPYIPQVCADSKNSFILEGILTTVVAVSAFFLVWDEPSTATFLSDKERNALITMLADSRASAEASQLGEKDAFDWKQVKNAFLDWQVSEFSVRNAATEAELRGRPGSTCSLTGEW